MGVNNVEYPKLRGVLRVLYDFSTFCVKDIHLLSVPALRSMKAQYKIDKSKGNKSTISEKLYNYALSINGMEANDIRKEI